jgi:hypothetical protein
VKGKGKAMSSRISRQLACKGGKVFSRMYWLPLAPRTYPWYSFLLEAESEVCYKVPNKVQKTRKFIMVASSPQKHYSGTC